jgi:aminoglycoside phosphotransferase (APT) family kinase protein
MHLDLHPGNVMLTPNGPVVIDWTSAHAGQPAADVATAYLIMLTSEVDDLPGLLRPAATTLRASLLARFRQAVSDDPMPVMAAAARARMRDRNVRPAETEHLRQIAERAGAGEPS